jgi:hypothetical protein
MSTYYIQLADQAVEDFRNMPVKDWKRVDPRFRRAVGEPGSAHLFRRLLDDSGEPSGWLTFDHGIEPYTAIFAYMNAEQRKKRAIRTSGRIVMAIPRQDLLDEVTRRLVAEANPDDWDWDY